jgi:hypothetical protein|nr:MAG TPA: hypothetical protein [Caudoviricetes sp.]
MKKKLCKPCAIKLTSLGYKVVHVYGKNEKVTCDECGNRRFGCTYEVDLNTEHVNEKA